jgi:3'(2'), 5'-bisphosphate nucleotidase
MPAQTPLAGSATAQRLIEIAAAAGAAAMRHYQAGEVETKADGSPVTLADRAAHGVIVSALEELTPDVPIVSEEGAIPPASVRQSWKRFWLVDPLDGTKEFIAGNGEFTVNIALIEDGQPVVGVVSAPALGITYAAADGWGAWKYGPGDRVQRLATTPGRPAVTRVVESRSHPSAELEAFVAALGPSERIRVGSSLKFCLVAEGAADIYPRFGRTMEWDVAAGDCVFRNSGDHGIKRPSPLCYNQPSLSTARFVLDGRA